MPEVQKKSPLAKAASPETAAVAVRPKSGPFQKLRGLQQYRRQQGHQSEDKGPPKEGGFAPAPPEAGSGSLLDLQPLRGGGTPKRPAEESASDSATPSRGGAVAKQLPEPHRALDEYFARELGPGPSPAAAGELARLPQVAEASRDQIQARKQEPQQVWEQSSASPNSRGASGAGDSSGASTAPPAIVAADPAARSASESEPEGAQAPAVVAAAGVVRSDIGPSPVRLLGKRVSPYQQFINELDGGEIEYLLNESSPALHVLMLKYLSRSERSRILQQMSRQSRTELFRSLSSRAQQLDEDEFVRAFRWLRRKLDQKHHLYRGEEDYPEISGMKVLSAILDGLQPEEQDRLLGSISADDDELQAWLERDRGSARQQQILRNISAEANATELALLFAIPRFARLLRHLLNRRQKMAVLDASFDLGQLPAERRSELEANLFIDFPILQEC